MGLLMSLSTSTAVSSGSACTSASLEPSYVLRAIGVDEELAHTSLRFGIGRFTTEEEVDTVIREVTTQVERLRDLSPLWELHLEAAETGGKTLQILPFGVYCIQTGYVGGKTGMHGGEIV